MEHTTKCHSVITKSTWAPPGHCVAKKGVFELWLFLWLNETPPKRRLSLWLPVRRPPRDAAATQRSGGPAGKQRRSQRLCALPWQLCRFTRCGTSSGRCESQRRLRLGCSARRAACAPERPGAQDLHVVATGLLTLLSFHGAERGSRMPFWSPLVSELPLPAPSGSVWRRGCAQLAALQLTRADCTGRTGACS